MSRAAMDWARAVRVDSAAKKALLKELAYRAQGPDHRCEVSQLELATATDQSERSVRRHLADLDGALLRRQRQGNGWGRGVDVYFLRTDQHEATPVSTQPANLAGNHDNSTGQRGPLNRPTWPTQPATGGRYKRHKEDLELTSTARREGPSPVRADVSRLPAVNGGPHPAPPPQLQLRPQPPPQRQPQPPIVVDDWQRAKDPLRLALTRTVLDAASERGECRLTPTDRKKLKPLVVEWLQAGRDPERLATAIANASCPTGPSILLEYNGSSRAMERRSVGDRTVAALTRRRAATT